jgi:hypothetical protein
LQGKIVLLFANGERRRVEITKIAYPVRHLQKNEKILFFCYFSLKEK